MVVYHLDGVSERRSLNIAVVSQTAQRTAVCDRFTAQCQPAARRDLVVGLLMSVGGQSAGAGATVDQLSGVEGKAASRHASVDERGGPSRWKEGKLQGGDLLVRPDSQDSCGVKIQLKLCPCEI